MSSARATSAPAFARRRSTRRLRGVAPDAQETEVRRLFLGVRRDERPLALPAHQQVLRRERLNRLSHRALRHTEARRELELGRNRGAGCPFAGFERALDQHAYLAVQGAERRWRFHDSCILYQI